MTTTDLKPGDIDVKSGHVYDWDDLTERGTVTNRLECGA